jgi:hypothetical protein
MTHPSPLPPSGPANRVRPVMFGQQWRDPNGTIQIAEHDGVLIEFLIDGAPAASLFQTVEAAMGFATTIASAAGQATNSAVGDDGKSLPITERLRRLHTPRLTKPER